MLPREKGISMERTRASTTSDCNLQQDQPAFAHQGRMKASRLQGANDRLGRVAPGGQHDGPFARRLEMGDVCVVSARCIEGDLEMRVDDAAWNDEAGCRWDGEGVGGAGAGRAEGGQGETGDVFAPATRGHCDGRKQKYDSTLTPLPNVPNVHSHVLPPTDRWTHGFCEDADVECRIQSDHLCACLLVFELPVSQSRNSSCPRLTTWSRSSISAAKKSSKARSACSRSSLRPCSHPSSKPSCLPVLRPCLSPMS